MAARGSILAVDDSPSALKLLTGILGQEGYELRTADHGALALASVEERPPELILLDIRMPGMDGFEVLRRLKAREESRRIPVIVLSAATELEQRVAALRLGAVDFVRKPFERDELLARVAVHLERFRLRTELEQQAAALRDALAQVKTLSGFISICAGCRKLRDDKGSWIPLEQYVFEQTAARLSHGLCPECLQTFFPDAVEDVATT